MKKHLLFVLMFGMSTLVGCGGSDEKKEPEAKPAATAPAATAPAKPAASAPAATPAPTPTPAPATTPAPAPTPANAPSAAAPAAAPVTDSGPMGDLIKAACACTTPECGSKAMTDLVALSTSGTAINLQGPDMSQLSQCVMASGIDKNEFITKMRQLRQQ